MCAILVHLMWIHTWWTKTCHMSNNMLQSKLNSHNIAMSLSHKQYIRVHTSFSALFFCSRRLAISTFTTFRLSLMSTAWRLFSWTSLRTSSSSYSSCRSNSRRSAYCQHMHNNLFQLLYLDLYKDTNMYNVSSYSCCKNFYTQLLLATLHKKQETNLKVITSKTSFAPSV